MSLKKILGLENVKVTDCELMTRIREAQIHNQGVLEFELEGEKIKMTLPNKGFDEELFSSPDTW